MNDSSNNNNNNNDKSKENLNKSQDEISCPLCLDSLKEVFILIFFL